MGRQQMLGQSYMHTHDVKTWVLTITSGGVQHWHDVSGLQEVIPDNI